MGSRPKQWDNSSVRSLCLHYHSAYDLCQDHPRIDDIMCGYLKAKLSTDTATRSLSRSVLFKILRGCSVIDIVSIEAVTKEGYDYSYNTLAKYACVCRGSSMAIANYIASISNLNLGDAYDIKTEDIIAWEPSVEPWEALDA